MQISTAIIKPHTLAIISKRKNGRPTTICVYAYAFMANEYRERKPCFYSREYGIHGSKIHIESGEILLTLELRVKRLRRFDLPPADLDHAMIRVSDQGKLPFLDLCATVLDDTSTKITTYRKPTHTDHYLNFNSHHPLIHKRSVVRTLTTRAQLYVTTAEDRKAKISHVRNALRANNYKKWALDVLPARSKN